MSSNSPSQVPYLQSLARLIRSRCVTATSAADSGHLTSSLLAADLMTFRFTVRDPEHRNNDQLIFSKGHASPLFCALWASAGSIDARELASYRQFGSKMEGHPTPRFPYAEAATGSRGHGLGIGLGMTLNASRLVPPAVPDISAAGRQRDGGRLAVGGCSAGKSTFVSTFAAFFCARLRPDQNEPVFARESPVREVGRRSAAVSMIRSVDVASHRCSTVDVRPERNVAMSSRPIWEAPCSPIHTPGIVYLRTLGQATPIHLRERRDVPRWWKQAAAIGPRRLTRVAAEPRSTRRCRPTSSCSATASLSASSTLTASSPSTWRLRAAADATGSFATIEDHYPAGGLGEAVLHALADRPVPLTTLAVDKTSMSGTADELRDFAGISAAAIVTTVRRMVTDNQTAAAGARRRSSGDRS